MARAGFGFIVVDGVRPVRPNALCARVEWLRTGVSRVPLLPKLMGSLITALATYPFLDACIALPP